MRKANENKFSPMREARFSCKATYLSLRSKKDSKSELAASPSKGKLFV